MGNGRIAALLCAIVLEAAFTSAAASPIGQVLASPPSAFEDGDGNYAYQLPERDPVSKS
jgi:hypothetical protein